MKASILTGARGRSAVLLMGFGLICGTSPAQSPAPSMAVGASTELGLALERTRSQGVPTVAIGGPADGSDSRAFYRSIAESAWARDSRGLVQIVEVPGGTATLNPQVGGLPSITVYTAGPSGIACRGRKVGCSAAEAVAWLGSLELAGGRPASDPALVRVNHDGGYPSAQAAQPPPVFARQPAPVAMMMVPQAAPATTSVVQMPAQNIMVQPGETRFFMAAPTASVAAPAPTMAYAMQPAAAAAPPANLFMPVAAAPPSQPMAAAPAPSFAAAAPVAADPTGLAAVTNQTLSLPTSASRTRVRVRGPGPIRAGLASFGERLTRLGRSRIETIQETEFNTPMSQGAGGGIATFSATSAAPIAAPPAQTIVVPQASAPAPAPAAPEYEDPAAFPQSPPKHGFLQKR